MIKAQRGWHERIVASISFGIRRAGAERRAVAYHFVSRFLRRTDVFVIFVILSKDGEKINDCGAHSR
jgi:hypothetical protein